MLSLMVSDEARERAAKGITSKMVKEFRRRDEVVRSLRDTDPQKVKLVLKKLKTMGERGDREFLEAVGIDPDEWQRKGELLEEFKRSKDIYVTSGLVAGDDMELILPMGKDDSEIAGSLMASLFRWSAGNMRRSGKIELHDYRDVVILRASKFNGEVIPRLAKGVLKPPEGFEEAGVRYGINIVGDTSRRKSVAVSHPKRQAGPRKLRHKRGEIPALALTYLHTHETINPDELAEAADISRPHAANALSLLAKAGDICRDNPGVTVYELAPHLRKEHPLHKEQTGGERKQGRKRSLLEGYFAAGKETVDNVAAAEVWGCTPQQASMKLSGFTRGKSAWLRRVKPGEYAPLLEPDNPEPDIPGHGKESPDISGESPENEKLARLEEYFNQHGRIDGAVVSEITGGSLEESRAYLTQLEDVGIIERKDGGYRFTGNTDAENYSVPTKPAERMRRLVEYLKGHQGEATRSQLISAGFTKEELRYGRKKEVIRYQGLSSISLDKIGRKMLG